MRHAARGRGVATRSAIAIATAIALISTGGFAAEAVQAAHAATTDPNPNALETANAQLSKSAASQGMVLLENNNSVLPIPKAGNIALFGVGSYGTVKGGTGSGDVNNRYLVTVRDGLVNAGYTLTQSPAYYNALTAAYTNASAASGGLFGPGIDYASLEQPLNAASVLPTAATDTAIFVIARNSGEGNDRSAGKGDYLLNDVETADLQLIGKTYTKVIVVLNTGGIIDTAFFDQINAAAKDPSGGTALDSMLLMSQAGEESGNAVTQVLNGTVTPSGKLTDTWASKYSYYPASATFANNDGNVTEEQYSEGIYVGYRYFDSLYKKINPTDPASVVDYPFGYGLSYTSFAIEAKDLTADAKSIVLTAKVTNTGKKATGRQVVQVYVSPPQTGLDKPYQELAGYAKTDDLPPGGSQLVSIRFNVADLASYDPAKAAYTLEAGDYLIRVGDSSRSTKVVAKVRLDRTATTEQLANEENDTTVDSELTSDPADFYSYPSQAAEIAKAVTVNLSGRTIPTAKDASPLEQNASVPASSPFYKLDGAKISSTTALIAKDQSTNWDGTGAPYSPKLGETVKTVTTDASKTLFDVKKGTYSLDQYVAGLSVEQLANIVEGSSAAGSTLTATGAAGYTTAKYESKGLPGMTLSDGPAGLRLTQKIASTPPTYQYATAWPIGTLLAQSWDPSLVKQVGTAIGKEMAEFGVTLWLAPGMNIHRDPLNGRNFEYYSEDPLVAGLTAAAATKGVQTIPGVGVTLKHFFGNNQETDRTTVNDVISERAAREIYLKGFEIAVKSAQPMAIMTSYNKVNDTYTSGTYDLNTDILRGEWGFKGLVMTDWGAGPRTGADQVYYSGNDLIEPGGNIGEVTTKVKKVVPTIDVAGLPSYSTLSYAAFGFTNWQWEFGGLTPSATGTATVTTAVDASIIGKQPTSSNTVVDALFNTVSTPVAPYTSVAAAYADVQSQLASATALTAAQKAGITVTDVVNQTPGDVTTPVVSYVVTVRGEYPASSAYTLRLGDLQRSASRIINIAMQSAGFAQLATLQNVKGITVGSYTGQFRNLASYLDTSRSAVSSAVAPHVTRQPAPYVSVRAGTKVRLTADASGDPYPSAQWQVSTDKGKHWLSIPNQNARTYYYTARKAYSGREFRVVFTNVAGVVASGASVLKVKGGFRH